jgi:hypothetical protein
MTFQIEGPFKGPLTMRQKIFIVKQMLKNIPLQEIAVGKPVRCKTIMRERKEDDFCAQRDTDGHIELSFTLNRTINELYLTVVIYDETVIGVNYLLGKIEN